MKKTLLLTLSLILVLAMALGLSGCKKDKDEGTSYTVDTSAFNSTVTFGGTLDPSGIKLVSEDGDTVAVSADMLIGVDTSTVGEKTLTVSYDGNTYPVSYTVKYLVTFVVNGVETSQHVINASEISVPETPVITGKQFEGWSVAIPNVITGNIRTEALYKTLSFDEEDVYTWSGAGEIDLTGYAAEGAEYSVNVVSGSATASVNAGKLVYTLSGDGGAVIELTAKSGSETVTKSWAVSRVEKPTVSIADGAGVVGLGISDKQLSRKINAVGDRVGLKYTVSASNANVSVQQAQGFVFVKSAKLGVTEITVTATNPTNPTETLTAKEYVVVTPETFTIANIAVNRGIEGLWTIGSESVGGTLEALKLAYGAAGNVGEGFLENISWTASDSDASVLDGVISLISSSKAPSVVEFKGVFSFMGVTVETAPMKVRCVWDGVNVFGYQALYEETLKANPRPIVLQSNIKDDFSATNYTTMDTTYDATYYANIGKTELAKIKVLLQFKNDLYGNGYEINAHNATLGTLDGTGKPTDESIFKGPLNFVAMSESETSAISVKGQDNICFAIYEGVTVNNVILKSCDLSATDGKVDLTDLDYAGTTVEVLGDGVTIEYSRLMNGRTVLRVFGDANDSAKKINLSITNSILSHAREFIIRMGSNRFVTQDGVAAPLLPGDSGSEYEAKTAYASMTEEQKKAYDERFINTFVTLKDSVLEEAGIFAIGMDAHFAGEALRDGTAYLNGLLKGWYDLAKTSYGAKLTFEGDVRLYNWKKLSDIDSSTLMENTLSKTQSNLDERITNMKFDVKVLVENIAGTKGFESIVDTVTEGGSAVKYVHNGIAFFGGGKNYSVFENKVDSTDFNHAFTTYSVKLDQLKDENGQSQGYLKHAAGNEPFYFVLYDANSTFSYEQQAGLTDKYSCVYGK